MGKFLVRIVVVFTTLYFLLAYYYAQIVCEDIMDYWYTVLFELIVVVYSYSEGKYHCRYLKHCALGILLSDFITRLDNALDVLSVTLHNLIPSAILFIAIFISFTQAIMHFHKVMKLKRMNNGK